MSHRDRSLPCLCLLLGEGVDGREHGRRWEGKLVTLEADCIYKGVGCT
jgi:hypothetical protein